MALTQRTRGTRTTRLIGCSVFVLMALLTQVTAAQETYKAVVDAGSSGTRLYLYKKTSGSGVAAIETLLETRPKEAKGLSSFRTRANAAGPEEIGPLVEALAAYLKTHHIDRQRVSVSVLATAGMRLIPVEQARPIYASVQQTFVSQGFTVERVATLPGQDEGLYAWVDLNYLKGNFAPTRPTVGIVEVGGASSQVAFASPAARPPQGRSVSLNGTTHQVVVVSYLGLGQNQARDRMLAALGTQVTTANPCYPNSQSAGVTYLHGKIPGNAAQFGSACFDRYAEVISTVGEAPASLLPLSRLRQTPGFAATSFVAISGAYHTLNDWKVLNADNIATTLFRTVIADCAGPNAWHRISTKMGRGVFAQNACANGTFIHSLLFSGAGLALGGEQIKPLEKIGDNDLTWTRGYALLN